MYKTIRLTVYLFNVNSFPNDNDDLMSTKRLFKYHSAQGHQTVKFDQKTCVCDMFRQMLLAVNHECCSKDNIRYPNCYLSCTNNSRPYQNCNYEYYSTFIIRFSIYIFSLNSGWLWIKLFLPWWSTWCY